MTNSALRHGWGAFYDPIIVAGWGKTILFIVLAPVLGMIVAYVLMKLVLVMRNRWTSRRAGRVFGAMRIIFLRLSQSHAWQ